MVIIASEKKIFQQNLIKNGKDWLLRGECNRFVGIDFEQWNNKENDEDAEILEKIPIFESQTAFTNTFDFANNLEIYFIRKKHVSDFFY